MSKKQFRTLDFRHSSIGACSWLIIWIELTSWLKYLSWAYFYSSARNHLTENLACFIWRETCLPFCRPSSRSVSVRYRFEWAQTKPKLLVFSEQQAGSLYKSALIIMEFHPGRRLFPLQQSLVAAKSSMGRRFKLTTLHTTRPVKKSELMICSVLSEHKF